jgi:peroxiredoxin
MAASTLAADLQAAYDGIMKAAPKETTQLINTTRADFIATYDPKSAIQVGDTLPQFKLSDAMGKEVSSKELLKRGPLLINFYRGEWCPYCNVTLQSLQKHLDDFTAKGVTLVAISPELPNTSLSTVEKHALKFPVLSDVGNKFARQLGIIFQQPESLRGVDKQFGFSIEERNGDDSLVLPVPATILVDAGGVVRRTFVEADYTKRLEPIVALEWIDAL